MTVDEMFARLNELRVANGKKALKKVPPTDKLRAQIAELAPERYRSPIANYARERGINPKVCRSMLRRHFGTKPGKWDTLTPEIKGLIDKQAARRAEVTVA